MMNLVLRLASTLLLAVSGSLVGSLAQTPSPVPPLSAPGGQSSSSQTGQQVGQGPPLMIPVDVFLDLQKRMSVESKDFRDSLQKEADRFSKELLSYRDILARDTATNSVRAKERSESIESYAKRSIDITDSYKEFVKWMALLGIPIVSFLGYRSMTETRKTEKELRDDVQAYRKELKEELKQYLSDTKKELAEKADKEIHLAIKTAELDLQRKSDAAVEAIRTQGLETMRQLSATVEAEKASATANVEAVVAIGFLLTALGGNALIQEEAEIKARDCLTTRHISDELLRMVGILYARLRDERSTDTDLDHRARAAKETLTLFIRKWEEEAGRREKGSHYAALLFNRACYRNRLARSAKKSGAEIAESLRLEAIQELRLACQLDRGNFALVEGDPDCNDLAGEIGTSDSPATGPASY